MSSPARAVPSATDAANADALGTDAASPAAASGVDELPADPAAYKRLVHGARFRALPLNVRCRARCAFCYENTLSKLLPNVRTVHIPPYDEARFDEFRQMHARACEWERQTGRAPAYSILPSLDRTPEGIAHFPNCDIFSSGLTHAQIEEYVQMRAGAQCLLYSVGLDIDPEFIAYLTRTYPDVFRLHLSIVTFEPTIRRRLMHPAIDVDVLRRVCSVTREATFFLMVFDEEQLTADVQQLLGCTSPGSGGIFIHKLYYDRASPRRVVAYSRRGEREREAALRAVARLPLGGRATWLSVGADVQAYTRRREIGALLTRTSGRADEVLFGSKGALAVIRSHLADRDTLVAPLDCAFGGNVDLVQGSTARDVIRQLDALLKSGRTIRQVWLPDAMFWVDPFCDVLGDTLDTVRQAFPQLGVDVLPVPGPLMWSVVDLDDALAFLDSPERERFETRSDDAPD